MKIPQLVSALVCVACAPCLVALAQQSSMPGMNMPSAPAPNKQPAQRGAAPSRKPAPEIPVQAQPQSGTSVPGMENMQGMHTDTPVTQAPQNGSITHDTFTLQEPEDPSHTTGSNLPAPDLLKEVVSRPAMTLQNFLDLADKHNPTLAEANALVRRSAAQARQAGLYLNPTIGYEGDQIRGGDYGGGEQGGFVQQTVVLGGKLGLRRKVYNQQKQSDQIGADEQTYKVHGDVTTAFYTTLTSQAMVVVRQHLLGVALDAVETVHQLANIGQADSPDILQAEVEAEQAKIDYVTTQREFIQNFRGLTALAGTQEVEVSPLAGTLEAPPEIDAERQVAAIVNGSPTVNRLNQPIAVEEARLHDARREAVPDLQRKAGEQYNFEHITEDPTRATGPQSFATAGIDIPLWNRNQGNVSAAEAEIDRAHKEVVREQLALQRTAEPLAQAYLASRFTVDRYRTQLIPRAQRAYQLYLQKYQAMAMAYPQVLVSQRTLFQLQIGYLSALHEVWNNAIALQNYTLTGGLDAPQTTGTPSTSVNLPGHSAGLSE